MKPLEDIEVKMLGSTTHNTVFHLVNEGINMISVIGMKDPCQVYGAVNKRDFRETKLISPGMFVLFREHEESKVCCSTNL